MLNSLAVRATADAKEAYENQQLPQMTLYILDSDIDNDQEGQRKEFHYNFPSEYVRTGEIEPIQEPVQVEFKLIPRPSAESE